MDNNSSNNFLNNQNWQGSGMAPGNQENQNLGGNFSPTEGQFEAQNISEEKKFSPPPPNVFVRTSKSDLEKIQSEGGTFSANPNFQQSQDFAPNSSLGSFPSEGQQNNSYFSPPPPPPPPSSPPQFAPQAGQNFTDSQTNPVFSEPSISFDAGNTGGITGGDMSNFSFPNPQPPAFGKKKFLIPIILGVLAIGAGFLGYFYLWPKFFKPKENEIVVTTTTLPVTTTTTTTTKPSPYVKISEPFQKQEVKINISGDVVVKNIKNTATDTLSSPGTFKIILPFIHQESLTSEEVILSLIPKLPEKLKPLVLGRKYLVFVYYGEVNPSLGLIIETGSEVKEEIKSNFIAWEKNLAILSDLNNFFLIKTPKRVDKKFKETNVAGLEMRSFAFSGKEAAINYAFFDKYLIISSSIEATNNAATHLQGEAQNIYLNNP